ncbi:MAG: DUF4157 domain-containing protein, partial [Jatrophihabitantaceae bacterium]
MPSTRTSFDLTAAADPAALERRCRAVFGAGLQLPPDLRAQLERAVGQDLSAVRIHADADADALAAAVGADAVTAGVDIFFRAGSFRPDQPHGRRLIGHEIGHVVDPRGRSDLPRPGTGGLRIEGRAVAEEWADTVADHVDRGTRLPGCAPARPVGECEPLLLSRHASWEHRLLGDAPAADLNAIANGLPNRQQLLQDLRDFLFMWHQSPQSVTQQMINARYPYLRTLQLETSGLLVTYGELNTLPDYLASPDVMDSLPAEYLLPILQAVRQEGYNKVQGLLNGSTASFAGSVAINSGWSMLDLLYETRAIDSLTQNF